ncbi:MaoC family dehydratase [Deinococcus pimensis]|uniref:MaoC family dehydratase n=1 Tax=Deinococcus pimensis TaxID=309888 RepID=UPI00048284C4|nr:MaoC family dehydratase [Deinococcus pimensis]
MSAGVTADRVAALAARAGEEVGVGAWVTVTQDMVNTFADATGDHQFIHVDPERAARTPFGGPVAHGFLTLSLLAGSLARGLEDVMDLGGRMLVNYGLNRVRFVTPVRVGRRVRARARLVEATLDPSGAFAQVTLAQTVEIEGEERPALVAEIVFRTYA